MRCLYCGQKLALLKRLTGGGDFCSDAHKQSYQEEYNRLALSRLLQAQSKANENKAPLTSSVQGGVRSSRALPAGSKPGGHAALPAAAPPTHAAPPQPPPQMPNRRTAYEMPAASTPPAYTPMAVQEPVAEEEVVESAGVETPVEAPDQTAFDEPVEAVPDAGVEPIEEPLEVVDEEAEAPAEVAVFCMEVPGFLSLAEETPYLEPWLDTTAAPDVPSWPAPSAQSLALSLARLARLEMHPNGAQAFYPPAAAKVEPREFAHVKVNLGTLAETNLVSSEPAAVVDANLSSIDLLPLKMGSAAVAAELALVDVSASTAVQEFMPPRVDLNVSFSRAAVADANLSSAGLLPLTMGSAAVAAELALVDASASTTVQEFAPAKVDLNVSFSPAAERHDFPSASPVVLEIRETVPNGNHHASLNGALPFQTGVVLRNSALFLLAPAGIDFPDENADVLVGSHWADVLRSETALDGAVPAAPVDASSPDASDESAVGVMEPPATPREALEALAKLHQETVDRDSTPEPSVTTVESVAVEVVPPGPPVAQDAPPVALNATPVEPPAAIVDVAPTPVDAPSPPVEAPPVPRAAHELLSISLKTPPPSKPGLLVETRALVALAPQMPRMKALPLRPKMAKAPAGAVSEPTVAPSKTPTPAPAPDAKSKLPAAPAQPADARPKSAPAPKPQAQPLKSAPTAQSSKPGQPVKPAQPVKPVQPSKPPQPAKPIQPVQTAKPAGTTSLAQPKQPAPAARTGQPAQPAKPAQPVQPAARPPKPQAPPPVPAAVPPPVPVPEIEETLPSFATVQRPKKVPFWGSLKAKLSVAILLVAIVAVAYIEWGGTSHGPASGDSDQAGPSIMLAEGGWVPGWAGDANGSHAGRQITIYRPSLKLSDYRIEFQGEMDSKSIGWVFRALDPYNYYALKLAIVTPGLNPKVALLKYSVVQGHETEIGRIPLNLAVRNDTVFSIRTDVRGSKFSTFVQGQPVDVWTDEQLKSGGVGFLNERAERARVKSVSISYLTGGKN